MFYFSKAGTYVILILMSCPILKDSQTMNETYLYLIIIHHLSEIQIVNVLGYIYINIQI